MARWKVVMEGVVEAEDLTEANSIVIEDFPDNLGIRMFAVSKIEKPEENDA